MQEDRTIPHPSNSLVTAVTERSADAAGHPHRWLLTRDFQLLWWSQVLSQVADGVSKLALLWFVYAVTGSPLKTTVIGLLQTLPPILLGPFIGVMVDRLPKKAILIGSDLARGLLIGLIPCWISVAQFTVDALYALTFLYGVATALFVPTLSSSVPFMVRRSQYTAANALLQGTTSLGIIIGPALSGLGIAFSGSQDVLCMNAGTYLLSALLLLPIRLSEGRAGKGEEGGVRQVLHALWEGLWYILAGERRLLWLVLLAALYTFAAGAFTTLFPVFGRNLLELGPVEVGYLWSWLGVGLCLTSLGLIRLSGWSLRRRLSTVVLFALLSGASALMLVWVQEFRIAALLVTCVGAGFGGWTPIAWGMVQEVAPPTLVGRVMALYTAIATTTSTAGMTVFGWVAESWGAASAVVGISFTLLLLALVSGWWSVEVESS